MFSLLLVGVVQFTTQKGAVQLRGAAHADANPYVVCLRSWLMVGRPSVWMLSLIYHGHSAPTIFGNAPQVRVVRSVFPKQGGPLMLRLYMAESSGLHLVLVVIESCVRQAVFWSWVFAPWTNDFTFIRCLHLSKCVRPSLRLTRTAANILGQCQV